VLLLPDHINIYIFVILSDGTNTETPKDTYVLNCFIVWIGWDHFGRCTCQSGWVVIVGLLLVCTVCGALCFCLCVYGFGVRERDKGSEFRSLVVDGEGMRQVTGWDQCLL